MADDATAGGNVKLVVDIDTLVLNWEDAEEVKVVDPPPLSSVLVLDKDLVVIVAGEGCVVLVVVTEVGPAEIDLVVTGGPVSASYWK